MRSLYGDMNILRALDETEFWKRQETEHAALIAAISPGLEKQYIEALSRYEKTFRKAENESFNFIERFSREEHNMRVAESSAAWIGECAAQSEHFVNFLTDMAQKSRALAGNELARTVIAHIIREGEYYLGAINY